MRAVIAGFVAGILACPALAADDNACVGPGASSFAQPDFALRHAAAAIDRKHLKIVVIGSASSTLPGPQGAAKAYPARLSESLTRRLPGVTTEVAAHTKARENAAEMSKGLPQVITDEKPDVVIWQAGTVDAMLGVDPDEFQTALDEGLGTLQGGKADVVLVNMQYSPRTEPMIALGTYLDAMRHAALQHEALLFDRFAVMKDWNETGVFDLHADTKSIDTAERVHDCIGRLLARLIVDGADLAKSSNTGAASPDTLNRETH